jgi:hypothetical protein
MWADPMTLWKQGDADAVRTSSTIGDNLPKGEVYAHILLPQPLALVRMHLGRSGASRPAFLILIIATWAGPLALWKLGGVGVAARRADFREVPARSYVITRPLFVPLSLSVYFYAILFLYGWLAMLVCGTRKRFR